MTVFIGYVFAMEKLFGVMQNGDVLRPLGGLALYLTFYTGSELLFGKTPGKFATRTKVVNALGERPTFGWLVLRSLCRFVPLDAISFLIEQRGWHDQWSRTYVVRENS